MVKIYPDTNRFVDFYRTSSVKLVVLDELLKNKASVVLTEQTITEFRRNRINQLNKLVKQFEETNEVGNTERPPLLRELPEYKELSEVLKNYKEKRKEVVSHLKQMISDEQKDPIAQKFLALAADQAVIKYKLTFEAIDRAHRRKLLGNPPCSPGKYTVGDEVIWELLIENMKDDLIVVTEDHTFHDNLPLLSEEYCQRTGRKLLLVTEKLSEALERIGQIPTEVLIEAEKKEQFSWPLRLYADLDAGQPFDGELFCDGESFPVYGRLIRYTNGKNGWCGNFFISDQAPIRIFEVYSLHLDDGRRGRIKIEEDAIAGGPDFIVLPFTGLGDLEKDITREWTR